MRHFARFAGFLACGLMAASVARADGMRMGDMPGHGGSPFAAGMAQMNHAMDEAKPTGDVDADFVSMMLPHHQGAVAMARVEMAQGKDPALRKLAKQIVAAQDREIAFMKAWQARHGAPRTR